jgi:SAM-dependent methyltransferase
VNLLHRWLCSSSRWKQAVEQYVLPWSLEGLDLGAKVLEVGPGYGATTDLLRGRVAQLTCVEIDGELAEGLRRRTRNQNVTVVCEDAANMSFSDASFDGAVCFTMLHHVPSSALQNLLIAEVARVLRPGGIFAGTDSLDSRFFRLLHIFDTLVVVDPDTFPERLHAAGFENIEVAVNPYAFRFRARKPSTRETDNHLASS